MKTIVSGFFMHFTAKIWLYISPLPSSSMSFSYEGTFFVAHQDVCWLSLSVSFIVNPLIGTIHIANYLERFYHYISGIIPEWNIWCAEFYETLRNIIGCFFSLLVSHIHLYKLRSHWVLSLYLKGRRKWVDCENNCFPNLEFTRELAWFSRLTFCFWSDIRLHDI